MSGNELGFQLTDIEARFALIQERIGEFPEVLGRLDAVVADFDGTTDEGLAAMEPKALDTQRSALNKQIKAVRDLRAAIGKAYDEPKKALYKAVDERLADADAILARCDMARKANKEAKLAERKNGLRAYYEGDVAASVKNLVAGFDDLFDPEWVKSDAAYKRAFPALLEKASRASDDWDCLKKMELHDREESERMFLRTLDLGATVSADEARAAELAEIKAMKEENDGYEPPVFEEVETEPFQDSTDSSASVVDDAPYRKHYVLHVWLSESEFDALTRWKNANCVGMKWGLLNNKLCEGLFAVMDGKAEIVYKGAK